MVSESELIGRLREFLRSSDLNTTTTATVRRQLEADFGIDLSDRKAFIREQVDLFLQTEHDQTQQQQEENDDVPEDEEGEDDPDNPDQSQPSDSKEESEEEDDNEEEERDKPKHAKNAKKNKGRLVCSCFRLKTNIACDFLSIVLIIRVMVHRI